MLDRLTEVFCEVDDFCQAFEAQWRSLFDRYRRRIARAALGRSVSEIITLLLILPCQYATITESIAIRLVPAWRRAAKP